MQTKQAQCNRRNEPISLEEIAGKKFRIYARVLIDPALAQTMEGLALRHEERKEMLLCGEKSAEKKKGETDE